MKRPLLDHFTSLPFVYALVGFVSIASAGISHADEVLSAKGGSVTYRIVHKLHKFAGISKKADGRVKLVPGGQTQVVIRIPVESFDSGNVNRDAHMKESVEAARFPAVEVKAVADGIVLPTTFPATVQKTFKGQVTLHGVTQAVDIPVTLKFEAANNVTATAAFSLSVDAFKIERPSLMFVKIDDEMKIDANLQFAP